jgi:hypothetical protein
VSGIVNLPPVENRGKVILLVDTNVTNSLSAELDLLKQDLAGDGWTVIRHDVARHDDSVWANNTNNIATIKSLIVSDYNDDPTNTKAIFIVGHVAVPYSGIGAEDSHDDHFGAWSTDIYYGDMDGIWTDSQPYPTNQAAPLYPETTNSIGDGKFDQNSVPTNAQGVAQLELSVGRVDFAKMPVFTNAPSSRSEIDLLRQYLAKDHAYRHKQFSLPQRALAHGYFEQAREGENSTINANALVNASAWFGLEPDGNVGSDCFLEKRPHLWGFQAGNGTPEAINNCDGCIVHRSQELTTNSPSVCFYMLLGSWFVDWNLTVNNFMRATLCTSNYGLAAIWVRRFTWQLQPLALGEPLGNGQLATANNLTQSPFGPRRVLSIMGDPTLRLQITAPVSNLAAATNAQGHVVLTWNASSESDVQYLVYRSTNSFDGPFTRLTANPVSATTSTDTAPPTSQKLYHVRTLKIAVSGSGSYTNLSQGVFVFTN